MSSAADYFDGKGNMKFGSLFSGIGGLDLGLERSGMECCWQVEIDPFCRKVLTKHWKDVPKYEDVRTVGKHNLEPVDIIAGGFPCTDIASVNTKGKGLAGERSGLWFEFYRIICELRPRYALIENVADAVNNGLERILCDLAAIGYDAEWDVISACAFGFPHSRKRLFLLAYPDGVRHQAIYHQARGTIESIRQFKDDSIFRSSILETIQLLSVSGSLPNTDGLSDDMGAIKGLGNAVVPQVAEWIGRQIKQQFDFKGEQS